MRSQAYAFLYSFECLSSSIECLLYSRNSLIFRWRQSFRWRFLDDVKAFDDVLSMTSELSMTLSSNDEQNIRHTIFSFKSSNSLIWFLIHSRRLRLVWIFFVKILHYFLCILKFLRIISRFIFVMIFSLD